MSRPLELVRRIVHSSLPDTERPSHAQLDTAVVQTRAPAYTTPLTATGTTTLEGSYSEDL